MGKLIQAILSPKLSNLTGRHKPLALLVHSPHDKPDAAVNFQASAQYLSNLSYATLNKGRLTFDICDPEYLKKRLKPMQIKHETITLWFESHGTLGWLFGQERCEYDELKWARYFVDFIEAVEKHTRAKVHIVVLNGCYTANEVVNKEECTYLNSPARILSMLRQHTPVLGFVGQNASAKITNVYHRDKHNTYHAVTLNLAEAAVLLKDGDVLESYHQTKKKALHCTHVYTPEFIKEACKLTYEETKKSETYYEPCLAVEKIRENHYHIEKNSYGEQQRQIVFAMLGAKDEDEDEQENIIITHSGI